jgi:DNA topoisomerase-1
VADAVKSLSKKADRVVIATDFDREGELIGVEALSLVFEANPKLVGPRRAGALLGAYPRRGE